MVQVELTYNLSIKAMIFLITTLTKEGNKLIYIV